MKKGIIIGVIIIIIGIGIFATIDFSEFSSNETESVEDSLVVEEPSVVEEIATSEGKKISVNLSDGIGAGDR